MEFKSNNIKLTINKINSEESLAKLKSDNFNIMFIAANNNAIDKFKFKDNIVSFFNIKDLKRQYHGQKYLYYSITFDDNGNLKLINDYDESDIYIIVAKREFKLSDKKYRYTPAGKLRNIIDYKVIHFINDFNDANNAFSFNCIIETEDNTNNLKKYQYINNIIVKDVDKLKYIITSKANITDEELDNINFEELF